MESIEKMNGAEILPVSIDDAVTQIEHLKGVVTTMGANDSEIQEIDRILLELKSSELTPEEAVARARGVVERKNDNF